jgi:hypothetical protein
MPVAHSDILSCDGKNIWMRSQKITFEGKRIEIGLQSVTEQNPEDFHIFCQNGFLDDSYFFRSYWTFGRRVTGGYGGWYQAGRIVPSGRILCIDDRGVYGYGRKPEFMVNSSVLEYQLFAADKIVTRQSIEQLGKAERDIDARSSHKNANSSDWRLRHFFPPENLTAAKLQWTLEQPAMIARAMTLAGNTLFIAGPPDLVDERRSFYNPDDPDVQAELKHQAEALEGKYGGYLWALAKANGKVITRYALDTIPVFDGMAAAGDSLYIITVDGCLIRFSATEGTALKKVDDKPLQMIWNKPEDPNYLLPAMERRESDFAKVTHCRVMSSELGYRLQATGKKQVGVAVKRLEKPITDSATFRTRMKAVPDGDGLLSNGYLAFGDAADDAALLKCGARLRAKNASIIKGPLLNGESRSVDIDVPDEKEIEIIVKVDLKNRNIVFTINGVTIEAKTQQSLKSITYVGYVMDSALIDFAPIEILTP